MNMFTEQVLCVEKKMSLKYLKLLSAVFTLRPVLDGSGILSGFMPFITQTAAMTSLTPDGGFFIALTIDISEG